MPNYKKQSNKQEKKIAKDLCGKTTIASGALYFQKADVRSDWYLVECKTTEKSFYSLKKDTWDKIQKEATKDGYRIPLMNIQLENGKFSFAVISEDDFIATSTPDYTPYIMPKINVTNKSFRINTNCLIPDFVGKFVGNEIVVQPIKLLDISLMIFSWTDFIRVCYKGVKI